MEMNEREEGRVKIYISCHKDCTAVQNEIFTPVRQKSVVRYLMNGTEEDKFMAAHANEYCELLTQYWAWKYEQADYYGFCHYRRYFEFEDTVKSNAYRSVRRDFLNARTARELGLNDVNRIKSIVTSYDVLAPQPYNYYVCTVYWQYKNANTLHIEDLNTVLDIIRDEYPAYYRAAKAYLYGHYMVTCNMFTMRRDLFCEYSEWLFGILHRFYELRDMAGMHYSNEAMRTPGHLGERLFGIYLTWLAQQKKYKIGRRRIVQFSNTEPPFAAAPVFGGNSVALFMPADPDRLALVATTLRSVADSASFDRKYDVVLLGRGLEETDRVKLFDVLSGRTNFSLRFYDADRLLDERELSSHPAAMQEAYCFLAIPHLFAQYPRAVWLDSGVVALEDIASLYDSDFGKDCCAAAADVFHAGAVNGFSERLKEYYRGLGIKNLYNFAEPGVVVMNTAAMRAAYSETEVQNWIRSNRLQNPLSDLLNLLCGGRIRFLDSHWNFIPEEEDDDRAYACAFAPKELYMAYRAAAQAPKVLHFSGSERPWENVNSRYAHIFWRVCRETPFAENLLLTAEMYAREEKKSQSPVRTWMKDTMFPRGSRRRSLLRKLNRRFGKN